MACSNVYAREGPVGEGPSHVRRTCHYILTDSVLLGSSTTLAENTDKNACIPCESKGTGFFKIAYEMQNLFEKM